MIKDSPKHTGFIGLITHLEYDYNFPRKTHYKILDMNLLWEMGKRGWEKRRVQKYMNVYFDLVFNIAIVNIVEN